MSDVSGEETKVLIGLFEKVRDGVNKSLSADSTKEGTRIIVERLGMMLVISSLNPLPERTRAGRALVVASTLVRMHPHPDPTLTKMLQFLVKDCTSVAKIEKMVNDPHFVMAGRLADTIFAEEPTPIVNH